LSTAEATAVAGNPAAAWPQGFMQAATGQQQYDGGPGTNRSALLLSESVQKFLVRDFGRLQCLTALHEASKVGTATAEGCRALVCAACHGFECTCSSLAIAITQTYCPWLVTTESLPLGIVCLLHNVGTIATLHSVC
jgi:hypothetical protein